MFSSSLILHIQTTSPRAVLVSGPNMGGKSCFVKMVALLVWLAQIGAYVPATRYHAHIMDGIWLRMGAEDHLERGESTFMTELSETAMILRRATARSLVVLDELGRGTSTHDGVAIAAATLRHLVEQIGCPTLFATHHTSLAQLAQSLRGRVAACYMSYAEIDSKEVPEKRRGGATTITTMNPPREQKLKGDLHHSDKEEEDEMEMKGDDDDKEEEDALPREIVLLYKTVSGVAPRSFGFHAARAAGLPEKVVRAGLRAARWGEEAGLRRALGVGEGRLGDMAPVATLIRAIRGAQAAGAMPEMRRCRWRAKQLLVKEAREKKKEV